MIEPLVQTVLSVVIALCTVWVIGLILLFAVSETLNIIRWAYARRGKNGSHR